jgi:transposase
MDNLSAHKGERVQELTEERGCKLLYLPPYSPASNLIEQTFFQDRRPILRKAEARGREALIETIGMALVL